MGMFDTVVGRCPKCGNPVEIQTKAGDCDLSVYPLQRTPAKIAEWIEGQDVFCPHCGNLLKVAITKPKDVVPMTLIEASANEEDPDG